MCIRVKIGHCLFLHKSNVSLFLFILSHNVVDHVKQVHYTKSHEYLEILMNVCNYVALASSQESILRGQLLSPLVYHILIFLSYKHIDIQV